MIQEDISAIFGQAKRDNTSHLNIKEFRKVIGDITERYPQVQLYLKKSKVKNMIDLLNKYEGEIDMDKFKKALSEVDTQMKNLPATAQVRIGSSNLMFLYILNAEVSGYNLGCCSTR